MPDIPPVPQKPRSRTRRFLTNATALIVAGATLSSMPAAAVAYNHRPEVAEEPSVAGRDAAEAAIAADDAAASAALTELPEAAWPEAQVVEMAAGDEFTAPTADTAVAVGPAPEEAREDWASPLAADDAAGEEGEEHRVPAQPGTEPPAASPTPSPDASPAPPSPAPTEEPAGPEAEEEPPAEAPAEPEQVRTAELEVLDRENAERLGVDGLLLRLARTDGGEATGPVRVGVDYTDFATAFGGDYGSRLGMVVLDDCTADGCGTVHDLGAENDTEARTLTAVAPAGTEDGVLLAVTASTESEGGTGDYKATPLAASSTWNVGTQTGNFAWSYPMAAPDVAGDLVPELGLGYSSQSVDGRTASSNNQTSWIGEGFDYSPGYIERRYKLCQDDGHQVADQCWSRHNATLSLNGEATELIIDADGDWHPRDDDGTTVERLTGTTNGDDDGEYWKVTDTDGTQYFFGRNRLPGWTSGDPETKSAWTLPVYGDDEDEPCHDSTFAGSWCQQAYKWNLDYVVDVHGNVMTYYYGEETNHYGRNLTTTATPYDRGGHLQRIEYGLSSGDVYATAPARVNFTTGERCVPTDDFDCAPEKRTPANARHWPDVPIDQQCTSTQACTGKHSASFWTTQKLDRITTQVHDGTAYDTVDSWDFAHRYPAPGDGTDPALWLDSITHTGHVGGTEAYPAITFGGTPMQNRVDSTSDGLAPMMKWRVTSIYTETGGQVDVTYSAPDCTPGAKPKPHENTRLCYPVIWTPENEEQLTDWFHKYVVTQVAEVDLVAEQPDVITSYTYGEDSAAWHFDDADGIVAEKQKTWSQFRGFRTVTVHEGHPGETRSETEHLFYQGMHGDKLDTGTRTATLTDSQGVEQTDHEAFNGMTREVIVRDGVDGPVVSTEISTPWRRETAERVYDWGTLRAYLTDIETTETRTALEEGERVTRVVNSFDDLGFITRVDDQGDVSTPDDDRCTRTTYARNAAAGLLELVAREETVDVACAATPSRPADVIADDRTHYDGQGFGAEPTRGLATLTERVADYDGDTPEYQTTEEATYDAYGRVLTSTDALDNTTTTAYTAPIAGGAATTVTTTNALGHSSTQHLDARSGVTAEVDANDNRTELTYDPLGRLTAVWLADRPRPSNASTPNMKFEYDVRKDAPTAVTTHALNSLGAYITSYELYDGLLRPRQTQAPAPGGGRVLTDVFYDSRGLEVRNRDAYYNEEAPSTTPFIVNNDDEIPRQTVTVYDGAGRATEELQVSRGVEQWRTTTRYLGDRTLVTEPDGGTGSTTITDARDRTVELRHHYGSAPEGEFDATTYTYAKNDELATVTDPGGNTWGYEYDLRGRKIEVDDPDAGISTTTYDALDRVSTTTDARGETLAYAYDDLGRKTEVRDDTLDGALRAEWLYDTVRKGQQTSATRHVGGEAYVSKVIGYDALYRPLTTDVTIPASEGELGGTYRFTTRYNPDGSIRSQVLPAAGGLARENVVYGYNELGMADSLSGATTIVGETAYSKIGDLVQREFTRGVLGSRNTWLSRDYEEATHRLASSGVVPEIGTGSLAHQTYDYDDAGNILRISDTPTSEGLLADVQCFDYDHMRRLTEAWTPNATGEEACDSAPAKDDLGGAAPYWHSFTYDEVGNRLSETQHATGGDIVRDYIRPGEGEGPAHAVDSVEQTGQAGTNVSTYDYDASGNMVGRTTGDRDQTLTWDAEGKLVKVTDDGHDTEFLYDADGERLIRRDGPLNTLYLPGMEVTFHTRDLSNEATRFYTHADETVAVKENDGTLSWLVSDHQGTGTMAINAVTGEWVQRRFTPFGQERASTGEWGTDKGFVGGIIDESTGFTQLGARAYDAALGRFISVDPVMDLSDPQQMHGYSYANNNPTTYSDPTGLAPKKSAGKPRPKSGGKSKGTIRKARRVGGRSPARQVNRGGSGYRGTRYTPVRVTYKRAGNRSGGTGKSRYSAPAKDPRAVALQSSRSLKSLAQQVPGLPPGCMPQFVVECYMSPSLKELSGALNYGRGKIGEGFDLIHRHAIVGGSACFGVCAGIQYQDGILSPFVGGFGVGGGYYGGYGHLSSRETGAWAPAVCGSRGFGGCLSAQTVRRRGMNFVEGFSVTGQGGAGFQIGGNMTVANVDVASLVRLEISRSIDFPEW